MEEILYIELNNWQEDVDFPKNDKFNKWIDETNCQFEDDKWAKDNNLCICFYFYDMSKNYLISAPKSWVIENCPEILNKYSKFLRYSNEDGDIYVKNRQSENTKFLPYSVENFGSTYIVDDNDMWGEEEDNNYDA